MICVPVSITTCADYNGILLSPHSIFYYMRNTSFPSFSTVFWGSEGQNILLLFQKLKTYPSISRSLGMIHFPTYTFQKHIYYSWTFLPPNISSMKGFMHFAPSNIVVGKINRFSGKYHQALFIWPFSTSSIILHPFKLLTSVTRNSFSINVTD